MDSELAAQLEQLSVGDSQRSSVSTQSSPSFPSPPSPPSASTNLTSLPSELLSHILESIPSRPSFKRTSTLASLCLVNRLFETLAMPILYREVHINTSQNFDDDSSHNWKLFLALTGGKRQSLVRGIRISAKRLRNYDFGMLQHIFSNLERLEWVRIRWDHQVDGRYEQKLVETIVKYSPRLKSLEIPSIYLDYTTLDLVFSTLKDLETFKGQLPGYDSDVGPFLPNLVCKLSKVILAHPVHNECFTRLLRLSHQTLTSLGLTFDSSSTDLDLSLFPNLLVLRLALRNTFPGIAVAPGATSVVDGRGDFHRHLADFVRRLRKIILSTQSIKSLSIIDQLGTINFDMSPYKLFDVLPKSLVHLTIFPFFLLPGLSNWSFLREAVRDQVLPNFNRITLTPMFSSQPGQVQHDDRVQDIAEEELRGSFGKFGIIVDRAVPVHGEATHFHSGWAIDPHGDYSSNESEEIESESDEETTSEEE